MIFSFDCCVLRAQMTDNSATASSNAAEIANQSEAGSTTAGSTPSHELWVIATCSDKGHFILAALVPDVHVSGSGVLVAIPVNIYRVVAVS